MVRLGGCPHRLHLPGYAALRVKAGADLRCPACRATATVGEADRIASHQHSDEVIAEALAIARQEGGRPQASQGVSERNDWYVAALLVRRESPLSSRLAMTQSPEPGSSEGHAMSRAQTHCMRFTKSWIYTPSYNRSALSEGRWPRRTNALLETGSPQPSSTSGAEPTLCGRGWTSRSAAERNEEDLFGEWRGTTPQPQADAPCRVCGRHMVERGSVSPGGSSTEDVP